MKSKFVKVAFVAAIVMVSAINVFNAQKSEILSDTALANVEALANDSESSGIDWGSHTMDYYRNCCKYVGLYSVSCSGSFPACK